MAASDVSTLGSFVIDTASKIQELGDNWYKASAAWKDFPLQVERLRRKHELWQAELTKFGMLSDRQLTQALQEAKLSLLNEEAKLLERSAKGASCCNACGPGCWPKLSMTLFPAQVGLSIEAAIRAFDDIPASLAYQEAAAAALEKKQLRQPVSPHVRKDDRYVPLQVSENAVHSALEENFEGRPTIVLLHGGPGKGKSTLARAVALRYEGAAGKAAGFDHVVYLECGQQADILTKQFILLQLLGAVESAPQEQMQQSYSGSDLIIRKRIKGHLKDQKLLLIFDDVWEGDFLHRMVELCGNSVKCLVTSQLRDLCTGFNFLTKKIQIEDVQLEDARKILASHLRRPDHTIPENVQKIADKLIQQIEGNPLGLASIAAAIDNTRCDELEVWEAASSDLLEMLHLDSREYILDKKYPRSFWSTMKLSFKSLETDARNLLMVVHMCGGLGVPEEVLFVLYRSAKVGFAAFAKLRTELESRQLVEVTLTSESPVKQRTWSLHFLQMLFIEEEMKILDGIEPIFISVGGFPWIENGSSVLEIVEEVSIPDMDVKIALAALYFNKQFAMGAASKMGIDIDSKFYKLRRSAIERITRLLCQPHSDRWTKTLHNSVKQVFMRYISNGEVHPEGILNLLQSPISILAMITTLKDIATIEETPLLDEKSHGFMQALAHLFQAGDGGTHATIREAAGEALASLCQNKLDDEYILTEFPKVLEVVVKLLSTDSHDLQISSLAGLTLVHLTNKSTLNNSARIVVEYAGAVSCIVKSLCGPRNPSLQSYAAWVLLNLACGDGEIKLKIIKSFGVLEELVKSLSKDDNPDLQKHAAWALANLANGDGEIKLIIINSIGALEELVKSLLKDNDTTLQEQAARTLVNLSNGDDEIKWRTVNSSGVVEKLVKSLSKDNNPALQEKAAWALANLANGDNKTKFKIINSVDSKVVEELLKSLSKDDNPSLQKYAATALANLGAGGAQTKLKIINSIEVVEELVKSLSKDDNPSLQKHAAMALANLGAGDAQMKLRIINSNGALEKLIKSLSKDSNTTLQDQAARALVNLACGNDEIKLKIINTNGAIEELFKSWSMDNNTTLQEQAARALVNLTGGNDEIKLRIVNSIGALDELVKILSKDDNPTLQVYATMVLTNLALGGDEMKLKIINSTEAMEELVKSLSKDNNPTLQEQATRALGGLAYGDDVIKLRIINSIGAVEELLKSLSKADIPTLQVHAARALVNLASGSGKIGLRIINTIGALDELVKSLSKDDNPALQEYAAMALSNLANGDDQMKLRIISSIGALDKLVKSLSKEGNPRLQKQAEMALVNLGIGDDERKSKILNVVGSLGPGPRLHGLW